MLALETERFDAIKRFTTKQENDTSQIGKRISAEVCLSSLCLYVAISYMFHREMLVNVVE